MCFFYLQVKRLGLGDFYVKKGACQVRYVIELLLSLPILPADKIAEVFGHIQSLAPADLTQLGSLFDYIERTWLDGRWTPKDWSVYYLAIRTNNDCEGLHNRWNRKGRGRKSFYWILSIMVKEANRIERTAKQLQYGCKIRERTAVAKRVEEGLFKHWDKYLDGTLNSFQLTEEGRKLMKMKFPDFSMIDIDEPDDDAFLSYPDQPDV